MRVTGISLWQKGLNPRLIFRAYESSTVSSHFNPNMISSKPHLILFKVSVSAKESLAWCHTSPWPDSHPPHTTSKRYNTAAVRARTENQSLWLPGSKPCSLTLFQPKSQSKALTRAYEMPQDLWSSHPVLPGQVSQPSPTAHRLTRSHWLARGILCPRWPLHLPCLLPGPFFPQLPTWLPHSLPSRLLRKRISSNVFLFRFKLQTHVDSP